MYVFLSLLQQMGLDGCLIGPPDAGNKPAGYVVYGPGRTVITGTPRGPFWAVGVRIGNEIKLYDPWRGSAFPATLGKLKANPDEYKAWFEDKRERVGRDAEEVKKAAVYLATPVNALSPRMAMLEDKLKAETDVNLAIDPVATRAAFPDPKPTYWNPPSDRFAFGRTGRLFLPHEEGGADRTERGAVRVYDLYFRDQVPADDRAIPFELRKTRMCGPMSANGLEKSPGMCTTSRSWNRRRRRAERLQRGQFRDAARALVERQDEFAKALLRVRNTENADKYMREWAERAVKLYGELGLVPNARAAIDEHWRSPGALLVLDRAVSEVGQAEASFLLALCKHEEAERVQARLERATGDDASKLQLRQAAADAWKGALDQWRSYRAEYATAQAGLPGRTEHVKTLAARAEKLAQPR